MNVAIVIGVSKYHSLSDLPACRFDAINIKQVLDATSKYEDVFCFTENTNAEQLKNSVRSIFSKYKSGVHVDEIFFYFSGHGVYHNDALLCCSDFDQNRPSSTSISNEELDDLIRSLSPKVAVKVIDACQSGTPYIKDASVGFEKSLSKSKLQSFICMASSHVEQSSYATAEESAFTSRWIDSVLMKGEGEVLYRDIQAALADAFVNNRDQTPFFVNQGTGLESFAIVTDEMRKITQGRASRSITKPEDELFDLISEAVARQDSLYVQLDDATKSLESSASQLADEEISEISVRRFYKRTVTFLENMSILPKVREVAAFAHEQNWEKKYFVKIRWEEYQSKERKNPFALALAGYSMGDDDYKMVTRSRPFFLEPSQAMPFVVAEVSYEPINHPGLRSFVLNLGIVHSVTEIMVLSSLVPLIQKGWSERSPDISEVQWQYQNYLWRDVVLEPRLVWSEALIRSEVFVKRYLEGFVQNMDSKGDDEYRNQ